MGRHPVRPVVEATVPVWVHHKNLALGVAHGDGVGVGASASGDGDEATDAVREEDARGEGKHAAHGGADRGVQDADIKVVEEAKLGANHVRHGENGEPGSIALTVGRIDAARPRRTVAAANDVGADDEEAVRIEGLPRAYEGLPPAGFGVRIGGPSMGGGGEASVEEYSVGGVGVEGAPGLIGDVEAGEETTPIKRQGISAVVLEGSTTGVGGLIAAATAGGGTGGTVAEARGAGFERIKAGEGESRVGWRST